ncbi:lipase maturation factor family protein [Acidicapsa acidisoli]|uniref:lipase maturation factor family protein n=1 Tax=Acidicapsa acidisoli TaxID=1615681 RepID=UPI0021E0501A|nr:lipase maturation factor family protein [Acidicapsa acidisoli]
MVRTLRNFAPSFLPVSIATGRVAWLFDSQAGLADKFLPRWIFLRALAAIYFSAFFSLLFQIDGLIGPQGILPAQRYLDAVQGAMGLMRFWYAPTLFWISAGSHAMMAVTWLGLIASVAAFCNLWPRLSFFVCFLCFLAFVTAAQDFSGYQSDGMLLEAGFIALFFAPRGLRPGLGIASPPSRASLFLLQWEWFRIYFESGMVKLLSGDQQWRNFTAMDEYYQNGPLPTWIGWYVEHLPHWFHAATVVGTLAMELAVVLLLFLPGRARLICFFIVTPWEIGVILTANYTFLNYLVLSLGFLLLDDSSIRWLLPQRFRNTLPEPQQQESAPTSEPPLSILENSDEPKAEIPPAPRRFVRVLATARLFVATMLLSWIGYATTAEMVRMLWSDLPLPTAPIVALEPFRIANQYGLFAVMTRGRYEIEFQGSVDGQNWTPYLFRYKPQALNEAPGIYAPYQPRFEWNLWFASLGDWQQSNFVALTEERLLENDPSVLGLFKANPFPQAPPRFVKAVLWRYWFTSMAEKRHTGNWWKRNLLGLYAPVVTRQQDGKFSAVEWPEPLAPHD